MPDKRGFYEKFSVERADGRHKEGEKHAGCEYFVLDLHHDPFALPALGAYAEACYDKHPRLASDLRWKLRLWRAEQRTRAALEEKP